MIKIIPKFYQIYTTVEYEDWFQKETLKSQVQILSRLSKIELEGHFGDYKFLQNSIWELKWINGRRIYYAYQAQLHILLLLGGNKNGQSKDITKAKKIFRKYIEVQD